MKHITKILKEKRKWLLALSFYAISVIAPIQAAIADPNPAIIGLEAQQQEIAVAANPGAGPIVTTRIRVSISAYTSTRGQTDSTPCISANGDNICLPGNENTVATNLFPFGTQIRIPALGGAIWTVRDRMNARYQPGHQGKDGFVDLYFGSSDESYQKALKFGRKELVIEVL